MKVYCVCMRACVRVCARGLMSYLLYVGSKRTQGGEGVPRNDR